MDIKRIKSLVTLRELSLHAGMRAFPEAAVPPASREPGLLDQDRQEIFSVRQERTRLNERLMPSPAPPPVWDRSVFHYGSLAAASGIAQLQGVRTYRKCSEMAKTDSSFDQLV